MTKYISKHQRISMRVKELMNTYPHELTPINQVASAIAFELDVKEKDVLPVLETAIQLGYFVKEGNNIISSRAQNIQLIDEKLKDSEEELKKSLE